MLTGRARDANGYSFEGVPVFLDVGTYRDSTVTNKNGEYRFTLDRTQIDNGSRYEIRAFPLQQFENDEMIADPLPAREVSRINLDDMIIRLRSIRMAVAPPVSQYEPGFRIRCSNRYEWDEATNSVIVFPTSLQGERISVFLDTKEKGGGLTFFVEEFLGKSDPPRLVLKKKPSNFDFMLKEAAVPGAAVHRYVQNDFWQTHTRQKNPKSDIWIKSIVFYGLLGTGFVFENLAQKTYQEYLEAESSIEADLLENKFKTQNTIGEIFWVGALGLAAINIKIAIDKWKKE